MDGTCNIYGGNEKYIHNFRSENLKGRGHLEDVGIEG
jgi:hypothetical protein